MIINTLLMTSSYRTFSIQYFTWSTNQNSKAESSESNIKQQQPFKQTTCRTPHQKEN